MRRILTVLLLLAASPAWGMEKPAFLAETIRAEAPLGEGAYRWAFIDVYDAALWTDAPAWSYDAPFALTLTYRINAMPADIREETIKQLRVVSELTPEELTAFGQELDRLYPEMRKGDSITALYTPEGGMALYHNEVLRGRVTEQKFVRPFFDIWLSDKTTEPKLRAQLLGNK